MSDFLNEHPYFQDDGAAAREPTLGAHGEQQSDAAGVALERSLGHTCYHIGQIVQVARIHAGEQWKTLTIPRGESKQFNKEHWGQTGKSHS